MFEELEDQYKLKVNTLMSKLPNNPYVIDIVGKAVQVAYEETQAGTLQDFEERLDIAIEMAQHASEVSKPMFYAAHLVQAPLLSGVAKEKYAMLDTASGTLRRCVEILEKFIAEPFFKKRWLQILELLKTADADGLTLVLQACIHSANAAVNAEEDNISAMYSLLGLAYLECSLRNSSQQVPAEVHKYKNDFSCIILNKANY